MWGSEDTRNVYAGLNSKKPQDRAGWLKPAATVLGGALGSLAGPGGMMAGAQLGGAAGGLGHDVANGQVTPQGVMGDVESGYSGFQGIDKAAQAKALIEAFMANPHQFRMGFAMGGLVPPPSQMDQLLQMLQNRSGSPTSPNMGVQPNPAQQTVPGASSDVLGAIPGQVNTLLGPEPPAYSPTPLQTPSHPGWEATGAVLAKLLESLPKPANPKNTKAIGAWAPALGVLAGAPGDIAAARRTAANTGITAGNDARRTQYEADKKAYEAQRGTLTNTGYTAALREKKDPTLLDRFHTEIPAPVRKRLGAPPEVKTYGEYDLWWEKMHPPGSGGGGGGMGGAPADDGYLLSPEALRQQAIHFAVTGTYALSGRNKEISKEQVRISNEAARLFPKRQLALARAAYNGDKSSMAKIVQGRDGIEAFAHSAEKNLGMMKDVLTQIPEAGAEVFNTPVRQFESQFRGNPAMSAFHALRMSLNAEYSRLTQSAQISGVGIPVSAQKEIERAIAPGATVGQILSAYQVLYEESSNRADAMNAMVEQIGQRMNLEPPADTRPPMSGGIKKGK